MNLSTVYSYLCVYFLLSLQTVQFDSEEAGRDEGTG